RGPGVVALGSGAADARARTIWEMDHLPVAPAPAVVASYWHESRPFRYGADLHDPSISWPERHGNVFRLDLRHRAYGPRGLLSCSRSHSVRAERLNSFRFPSCR